MVAASSNRRRRMLPPVIPVVDLSLERPLASQAVAKACEEIGFFKVINHGIQPAVSARLEAAGMEFFALPAAIKQTAGPPDPLGYGCRKIGLNGDIGEVEYLLLPTDECSVYKRAVRRKFIFNENLIRMQRHFVDVSESSVETIFSWPVLGMDL